MLFKHMENVDDSVSEGQKGLSAQFSGMSLKSNVFEATVNEEENRLSSLNDFHLAETDLIRCLLRTNIIQRIR